MNESSFSTYRETMSIVSSDHESSGSDSEDKNFKSFYRKTSGEDEDLRLCCESESAQHGEGKYPSDTSCEETLTYSILKIPEKRMVILDTDRCEEKTRKGHQSSVSQRQTLIPEYFPKKKPRTGQRAEPREREKAVTKVTVNIGDNNGSIAFGSDITLHEKLVRMAMYWQVSRYVIHQYNKLSRAIARISSKLYHCRDNGLWDEFYRMIDHMLGDCLYCPFVDCKIFLLIEKSIGLSYEGKYENSRQVLNKAHDLINTRGLLSKEICVALYKIQESALLRRDKKYAEARLEVEIAEQNMAFVICPPFLMALLLYELGNVLCVDDGTHASEKYKACIDYCRQHKQNFPDVYVERDTFCLPKLGEICLNSQTGGRKALPSEVNISEAEKFMKEIQKREYDTLPGAVKMMTNRCLSNLAEAKNDKQGALNSLKKAKELSVEIGFGVQKEDLEGLHKQFVKQIPQ